MNDGFERFCQFLQNQSGIVLGAEQRYLVSAKLGTLLREHGIDNLHELLEQLEKYPFGRLREQVIDAMCIHETLWFRDGHPFEAFKEHLLPARLAEARHAPLRIWSAAAASGQEPYSIAMSIDEFERSQSGLFRSGTEIIASELSTRMLAVCERGEYDALAIRRGLSAERLARYFKPIDESHWRVLPTIRQRVTFRLQNLLDSYAMLGQFDIIFCRNVLIYFSQAIRESIIKRLHERLKPSGYLLLGATESLGGLGDYFKTVRCKQSIVYQAK